MNLYPAVFAPLREAQVCGINLPAGLTAVGSQAGSSNELAFALLRKPGISTRLESDLLSPKIPRRAFSPHKMPARD